VKGIVINKEIIAYIQGEYVHNGINLEVIDSFRSLVYEFYSSQGRSFPWRETHDPYAILLSEVMLQQTQTYRVERKYLDWLNALPSFTSLAEAEFSEVLRLWQGLGYNRRALALHRLAQEVVTIYGGQLPKEMKQLSVLPGIGTYTAAAIRNFSFKLATPLIETNIRTVYLHIFFPETVDVHDKQLMPLIEKTMDVENCREWFYALMDLGVLLKKYFKNPSRKSRHHSRQSKFEGSDRQIRGQILRLLLKEQALTQVQFQQTLHEDSKRIQRILETLLKDQLLIKYKNQFRLNN
jgi:A/G-specific adenine glycosylase